MSQSGAEGRRRLTVWRWLLQVSLVCVGVIAFVCAGAYIGLVLVADQAQARMNQQPTTGVGLAGAGQGFVNFLEWLFTLGAGALIGGAIGGLVGVVALVLSCRYWIAPWMRRVPGLSGSTPNG